MQLGDGLDQRETQATARRRAAFIQPVERPEDPLALMRNDARPVVGHVPDQFAAVVAQADDNLGSGRGMAQGVLAQVGEQLRQQRLVPANNNSGLDLGYQPVPGILGP